MQLPAIQMNRCDAFQPFRTSQIFVGMWHFQLHLCRPNLTYAFVSYESDYWDTIYPEITTYLSVNSWGWQYISGDYLHLHLNLTEEICCKVCVKGPKHSLRNLLFSWIFFFCILFSRGIRNKQEHAISKNPNAIVLTNSQSTVLPTPQCFPKFLTAVWNEEYVYLNSPLWNQLSSILVCGPNTQSFPLCIGNSTILN